uniref:Uncharacterized protein n=1 Tax=Kalanchoe fedtschenkoi TaxID=63787 RepID=A0A7N0VI63_KALFE
MEEPSPVGVDRHRKRLRRTESPSIASVENNHSHVTSKEIGSSSGCQRASTCSTHLVDYDSDQSDDDDGDVDGEQAQVASGSFLLLTIVQHFIYAYISIFHLFMNHLYVLCFETTEVNIWASSSCNVVRIFCTSCPLWLLSLVACIIFNSQLKLIQICFCGSCK